MQYSLWIGVRRIRIILPDPKGSGSRSDPSSLPLLPHPSLFTPHLLVVLPHPTSFKTHPLPLLSHPHPTSRMSRLAMPKSNICVSCQLVNLLGMLHMTSFERFWKK